MLQYSTVVLYIRAFVRSSSTPNQAINCFIDPANEKVVDRLLRSGLCRLSNRVIKYLPFNPTQTYSSIASGILSTWAGTTSRSRPPSAAGSTSILSKTRSAPCRTVVSTKNSSLFARESFFFPSLHPSLLPSLITTPPVMMSATSILSRSVGHVCRRPTHCSVGKGASSLTLLCRPQTRTSSYVA